MSVIKSFSFPEGEIRGDMFYIKHNNGTFTVIDCYLKPKGAINGRIDEIVPEIQRESAGNICRFISTHPDDDHIAGLDKLDAVWPINNFYSVPNDIPADKGNDSLTKYIELRDSEHNFIIKRGIFRAWLNDSADGRDGAGVNFYWPQLDNEKFIEAQNQVAIKQKVNNICPIFTYSLQNGATVMWMGDLETGMQQEFYNKYSDMIPHVDILFQPHHGRKTGALPAELLEALNPSLIIIGNAPYEYIDYGDARFTITQNTAGDVVFDLVDGKVHIYTQNTINNAPTNLVKDWHCWYAQRELLGCRYLGTLNV